MSKTYRVRVDDWMMRKRIKAAKAWTKKHRREMAFASAHAVADWRAAR